MSVVDSKAQCDQMTRLVLHYLPTYKNENLPKSMKNLPIYYLKLAKF